MDSAKRSSVTPSKSRLARTFTKVLHIRAATGKASDDAFKTKKSREMTDEDPMKNDQIRSFSTEDQELRKRVIKEAFLAKLFATLSSVKAAYALLQFSQSPYDSDGIKSADQTIVSELKSLSGLKQSYLKERLSETSPETALVLSEIQEQKSLLKIYEITSKKLDSQLKLKESEITFLKDKLVESTKVNKSLEKGLNSSRQFPIPENTRLSSLRPSHFVNCSRLSVKSMQTFVHLLISEMESADWDLDAAANSIETGVSFWKPNHKSFVFESFVCKEMFDGFNDRNFAIHPEPSSSTAHENPRNLYFDRFMELKSVKLADYLAWKPKSTFATFCRAKYLKLIHPKMEASLFGNLDQRNMVSSGELPDTPFFSTFSEMAKRIWLLHCLALSFDPEASVFQAKKGSRFSEVYMESLNDEAFLHSDGTTETDPRVGFTVFPGFRFDKTIAQCQVYLSRT